MPRTQLSGADVAAICDAFALGTLESWRRIEAGTINSNYVVECVAGTFFVRVNEGKSEAQVRYEAELVAELERAGVSTVIPLDAGGGRRYLDMGGALVSVFPWIAGEQRDTASIEPHHCEQVGVALAELHRAGSTFAERFESDGIYSWPAIEERFATVVKPCGDPALAGAIETIESELLALATESKRRASAPRGVIHGDLFPDNVIFAGNEAVLIDFEQASTGSLVYDLAVAINAWCYADGLVRERIDALIAGYELRRQLEAVERALLPVELRASALRFAITRITDVYLPGLSRMGKDYRAMLERVRLWRDGEPALPT